MPSFKPTEDIISMSEFRTTLADCVVRTAETHRPIILTQNGRATSVFMNAADWERIAEKLEKAETYEDILIAEGEADRGETYSIAEVEKMLDQDAANLTKTTNRKRSTKKAKTRK